MAKWLLVVAYPESSYEAAQKEWLKMGVFLTMVPTMEDALVALPSQNYVAIAVFNDDLSFTSLIPEARKIKPNIPVICLVSDANISHEQQLHEMESVMCIEWPSDIRESVQKGYEAIKEQVKEGWTDELIPSLKCKELVLYPEYQKVFFMGKEVELSAKQFRVLNALMANRGRPLTFDQIYDAAYDEHFEGGDSYAAARSFITAIRTRISIIGKFDYIENVRSIGYRMISCIE